LLVGGLLCLVEIIAGFGLLKMRYWGRNLGIFYGVVSILIAIGSTAYSITIVQPAMKAWQADVNKWVQTETQKAAKGGPGAAAAPPPPVIASNPLLNLVSSVVGAAVALIYPIIILIVLLLPSVGRAFAIANGDLQPEPPVDEFDRRRDDELDRVARRPPEDRGPPPEDEYRYRAKDE
jgi:hypothetical protein